MKPILLFVFIFFSKIIYCQQEQSDNIYWNFYSENKSKKFIVGVNNCYIRSQASSNSALLDSLQLGAVVTVTKEEDNEDNDKNNIQLRGITAGWYKVDYTNSKGKDISGFIWKGFLALGYVTENDLTYLTTIEKIESLPKNNTVSSIGIIALNNKKEIIDKIIIRKNIIGSYFFTNKLLGSLGLNNLKNIYRVEFSGEACSIPNLYYYFGFSGTKFIKMPEKYSVADGGVYYYGENFIFPLEKGGKPNFIFKKYESGEVVDEVKNIYQIKEWDETYKWTGEKAILISKSKIKKYIKK